VNVLFKIPSKFYIFTIGQKSIKGKETPESAFCKDPKIIIDLYNWLTRAIQSNNEKKYIKNKSFYKWLQSYLYELLKKSKEFEHTAKCFYCNKRATWIILPKKYLDIFNEYAYLFIEMKFFCDECVLGAEKDYFYKFGDGLKLSFFLGSVAHIKEPMPRKNLLKIIKSFYNFPKKINKNILFNFFWNN